LLGILVLFTLTSSLVQQISTALLDVRYSTIFIVGIQFTRAIMVAGAAILFRSVESLIIATMINQLLSIAVLFWYLHGRFPATVWQPMQRSSLLRLNACRHGSGRLEAGAG
jgi:hypothetical protein